MNLTFTSDSGQIDWAALRLALIADDFHNGRSIEQLRLSFENSQVPVYVLDQGKCIATARALSDGVCNCYVVDVWTQTSYRHRGIASKMMEQIIASVPGQHIYLQSDDSVAFYEKLGFRPQPEGLALVSGQWLVNSNP